MWPSAPRRGLQERWIEVNSQGLSRTSVATLAVQIARDGEGATKLLEVTVRGAADEDSAVAVARTIVASPLVKTAIYGEDPNWAG